jgi:hypothetical protein
VEQQILQIGVVGFGPPRRPLLRPAIERPRSDDFVGCRDLLAVLGDGSLTGQGWRHLERDVWIVNLRGKQCERFPATMHWNQ